MAEAMRLLVPTKSNQTQPPTCILPEDILTVQKILKKLCTHVFSAFNIFYNLYCSYKQNETIFNLIISKVSLVTFCGHEYEIEEILFQIAGRYVRVSWC